MFKPCFIWCPGGPRPPSKDIHSNLSRFTTRLIPEPCPQVHTRLQVNLGPKPSKLYIRMNKYRTCGGGVHGRRSHSPELPSFPLALEGLPHLLNLGIFSSPQVPLSLISSQVLFLLHTRMHVKVHLCCFFFPLLLVLGPCALPASGRLRPLWQTEAQRFAYQKVTELAWGQS